jgi:MFS family permease
MLQGSLSLCEKQTSVTDVPCFMQIVHAKRMMRARLLTGARLRLPCSLFADSNFFGQAMGITESFLSLAWVIGPMLGGFAADAAGFAAPFVLTALLALLSAPILAWLMPAGESQYALPAPPCATSALYLCSRSAPPSGKA